MSRAEQRSCATEAAQEAVNSSNSYAIRIGEDPMWTWGVLFLLFTALGVLKFSYFYLDDLARNRPGTALVRGIEEATGFYTAFILLPLVTWFARKFPWRRVPWPRFYAGHLAGAICFSLAHTTLMALSRAIIFPAVGQGQYDYGIMWYRYPMEFSGVVSGYAIIVGFIYFFQRVREARQRELITAQLQTRLAETQLENLRLQLNPHFLFNTLNMISSVMYEDVKIADAMIARLCDLLRFTLKSNNQPEIRFAEEIEITRMYLEIMEARFEEKLKVQYDVQPEVQEALIPQLLLQPLVENAVRHGMNEESGVEINVQAERQQDDLLIRISDSGPGIRDNEQLNSRGIGLANTEARLQQLYGSKQQLRINNRVGGGTEVRLKLPFRAAPGVIS